jgi:hypothetical protein
LIGLRLIRNYMLDRTQSDAGNLSLLCSKADRMEGE